MTSAEDKMNFETKRLLESVTWDWQPLSPIIQEMTTVIPPGKALRKYEQAYRSYKANHPDAQTVPGKMLTDDEKIASGANALARARVRTLRLSERIEIERIDGVEMVRLKNRRVADLTDGQPCPTCAHPFAAPTPIQPPRRSSGSPRGRIIRPMVPAWEAMRKAQ